MLDRDPLKRTVLNHKSLAVFKRAVGFGKFETKKCIGQSLNANVSNTRNVDDDLIARDFFGRRYRILGSDIQNKNNNGNEKHLLVNHCVLSPPYNTNEATDNNHSAKDLSRS